MHEQMLQINSNCQSKGKNIKTLKKANMLMKHIYNIVYLTNKRAMTVKCRPSTRKFQFCGTQIINIVFLSLKHHF